MEVPASRGRRSVSDWEKNRVDYDRRILDSITSHTETSTSPVDEPRELDSTLPAKEFEDRVYDLLCKEHRHIEAFCKTKRGLVSWKLSEIEKAVRAQERTGNEKFEQGRLDRAHSLSPQDRHRSDQTSIAEYVSASKRLDKQLSEIGKCIKTFSKFVSNAKAGFEGLVHTYEEQSNSQKLHIVFEENIMDHAEFVGTHCDPIATLQHTYMRLRKSLDEQKISRIGSSALPGTLIQEERSPSNRLEGTALDPIEAGSTTNTVSTAEGGSSGSVTRAEQSSWTMTESEHSNVSDRTSSQDIPYAQVQRSNSRASRSRLRSRSKSRERSPEGRRDGVIFGGEQNEVERSRKAPTYSTWAALRRWINRFPSSLSPGVAKAQRHDEEAPLIQDELPSSNRPDLIRETSHAARAPHYATFSNIDRTPASSSNMYLHRDRLLEQVAFFAYSVATLLLLINTCLLCAKSGCSYASADGWIVVGVAGCLIAVSLGLACTMMRRPRIDGEWLIPLLVATALIYAVNAKIVWEWINE